MRNNTISIGAIYSFDCQKLLLIGISYCRYAFEVSHKRTRLGLPDSVYFRQRETFYRLSFGISHASEGKTMNLFLKLINEHKNILLTGYAEL